MRTPRTSPTLSPVPLPLYYHPLYTDGLDDAARFPKHRYRLTRDELVRRRAPVEFRTSPPATRNDALEAHAAEYVDAFMEGRLDARRTRQIGLTPWTESIRERTMRLLGGSLAALDSVALGAPLAGNLGGGTHHARRAGGAGYCVFNDLAILARRALRRRQAERVLILDLDVHQGDGTAAMLRGEPRAVTASVHCRANFPFRKVRGDVDVPLAPGTSDDGYVALIRRFVPRLIDRVQPDLVLFQAGVDPLREDHLGRLSVSRRGLQARNQLVLDEVHHRRGLPMVVTMGGGYARPIEASVAALADVFEMTARATSRSLNALGRPRHAEPRKD